MTTHHGPVPVPARITIALDMAGLYGPKVDEELGGFEPMVDDWEAGKSFPTPAQVQKLSEMTGFPVAWFYAPADELGGEMRVFVCDRSRRGENGLTILRSWVDWDGVLQVVEETPPRPPKRRAAAKPPPAAAQAPPASAAAQRQVNGGGDGRGWHEPVEDPDTPGCCQRCRSPMNARNGRHRRSARRRRPLPD